MSQLYIAAEPGLGKTHLSRAAVAEAFAIPSRRSTPAEPS